MQGRQVRVRRRATPAHQIGGKGLKSFAKKLIILLKKQQKNPIVREIGKRTNQKLKNYQKFTARVRVK